MTNYFYNLFRNTIGNQHSKSNSADNNTLINNNTLETHNFDRKNEIYPSEKKTQYNDKGNPLNMDDNMEYSYELKSDNINKDEFPSAFTDSIYKNNIIKDEESSLENIDENNAYLSPSFPPSSHANRFVVSGLEDTSVSKKTLDRSERKDHNHHIELDISTAVNNIEMEPNKHDSISTEGDFAVINKPAHKKQMNTSPDAEKNTASISSYSDVANDVEDKKLNQNNEPLSEIVSVTSDIDNPFDDQNFFSESIKISENNIKQEQQQRQQLKKQLQEIRKWIGNEPAALNSGEYKLGNDQKYDKNNLDTNVSDFYQNPFVIRETKNSIDSNIHHHSVKPDVYLDKKSPTSNGPNIKTERIDEEGAAVADDDAVDYSLTIGSINITIEPNSPNLNIAKGKADTPVKERRNVPSNVPSKKFRHGYTRLSRYYIR